MSFFDDAASESDDASGGGSDEGQDQWDSEDLAFLDDDEHSDEEYAPFTFPPPYRAMGQKPTLWT